MVLAAGLGTRLRPVTNLFAKPAVPFFGRPILLRTLDLLAEVGVTEAVVNTHYRPADVDRLAETSPVPLRLSHEPEILGTGGGLANVRDLFRGEEAILLVNGDVVFDLPLAEAFVAHRASGAAVTLLLLPNPDPSRYGRVLAAAPWHAGLPDDPMRRIDRILGPAPGGDGFLYTGSAIFSTATLARLPEGASDLVPALLRPLAEEGKLAGFRADGLWYELGTPADLLGGHLDLLRRIFGNHPSARGLARRIVDRPLAFDRKIRSAVHPGARVAGIVDECIVDAGGVVGAEAEIRRALFLPGGRVGRGIDPGNRIVFPA